MIMERRQSITDKMEASSYPHNDDPDAKILLPADYPGRRDSRQSGYNGIPKVTEHRNSKGTSLKDIRRLSTQSTVWDLQKSNALESQKIMVYKRRWLMLAILMLSGIVGTVQWSMYSIIANVITKYYNVPNLFVDMTNLSFFMAYLIFFLPATWLFDRVGMRCILILSCFLNAIGCSLRLFTVPPDRFWLSMLAQIIVAVSQVPTPLIPTRLAVVWFPAHQVSLGISFGMNGFLVGGAVGFIVAPMLVRNSDNMDEIGADLNVLFIGITACTVVVLAVVVIFFQDQPPLPPSQAQKIQRSLEADKDSSLEEFVGTLKRLLRNKSYLIVLLSFSLNVGVYEALATLLNRVLIPHFPGHEKEVGLAGLILILSSAVSTIVFSFVLDRTHAFKILILSLYLLSIVGWLGLAVFIHLEKLTWVIIITVVFGIAQGNQPMALQLGIELTYPAPETISSGFLEASLQISSVCLTLLYGYILDTWGDVIANAAMTIPIIVGIVSLIFLKPRLKRQEAEHERDPEELDVLKR